MNFRNEIYDGDTVTTVEYDLDTDTYTETVDGTVIEVRPLTPEEQTHFTATAEAQERTANEAQMVTESDDAVDKLVAVVEALNTITSMTNAAINANPAAVIKNLVRECKTIARQANREARMTSGRTESTHTGTEVL